MNSTKAVEIMAENPQYKVQQIIDNGNTVQLNLAEDVQLEPVSQKQLVMDAINKKLDPEMRDQIQPVLEAILQSQPNISMKSYAQTSITITMPKRRYEKMGKPQVGENLDIDIKKAG